MEFEHSLSDVEVISGRHPFIVDRCRGKVVLHVGCVDSGLLEARLNDGELLHQKLSGECAELWGCDIDKSGVEFLTKNGYSNVFFLDLEDEVSVARMFQGKEFDVVVFSEVAEHLSNPGKVLILLGRHCVADDGILLFSVPNAFSAHSIWQMINNVEYVHPDHNYYFSHVTALNILRKNGFKMTELYSYTFMECLLPKKVQNTLGYRECVKNGRENLTLKQLYWRALNWYKRIPEKLFFKYLYSKNNYWGEGLMIVARKDID